MKRGLSEKGQIDLFNRLKPMNILLVDDDEWIRDSMRLFFEGEGCRLTTYETAEEAIERIRKKRMRIQIARMLKEIEAEERDTRLAAIQGDISSGEL